MAPRIGTVDLKALGEVVDRAKKLAIEYRKLTNRPLGVTGEIAEYEAATLLGLELAEVRQPGYDAIGERGTKFQIKARCLGEDSKRSQQMGSIKVKAEWDAVLLVVLDANFDPVAIYRAERGPVTNALLAPGSKARNVRGALSISKFKAIGRQVWVREMQTRNV